MQKSKSSSNVGQFVSKKIWKSRSKSQTRTSTSLLLATKPEWTPTGNCTWTSVTGQQVTLSDVVLHNLSEVEMKILQRVAIEKINQLNIGVSVAIPSDGEMTGGAATTKSAKRRPLAKKKAMTTSFFDIGKKDDKNSHVGVFGNSLENCIANEQKRRDNLTASSTDRGSRNSITSLFRGSSSSSSKANDNVRSCQSLSSKSFSMSSSALHQPMDAVNTSKTMSSQQMYRSQWDVRRSSQDNDDMQLSDFTIAPPPPVTARRQVPNFVSSCIRHLEENGLHSVGIFRVSTSMKRVRQMREEFDRSSNTVIGADTCPHDVATLLKEFLRDLPEPLLCRCLYKAFVKTQKIRNRRLQLEAISHLVQLLPIAHRDTLYVLLKFLAKVAACSDDVVTSGGVIQINGNKMDSNNLATVFAPNILRLGSRMDGVGTTIEAKEAEQESMTDVINVIRTMIDHCDELFRVSAELMDEVYTNMIDTFPQQLNSLCERRHITDLDGIDSTSSGTPLSSPPPPTNIEHLGGGGVRRQNPFSQQHQLEIFGSDFSDVMCPTSDPTMTTAKLQQAAALSPSTAGSHQQRQRNIPHDGDLSLSPAPKLSPARKVYSRESVMHENAASKGGNSTAAGSSSSRRRITKQKYSESDSAAHRSLGVGSGRGSGGGTTSRGTPSNSDNLNTPTMTTTTTVTTVRKRNTTEQSTDNDFHSMSDYSISHYPLHRHQQHQQQPHQQILSKMQQQNVRPFSGGGTTVKTTTGSASDFAAAATVTTATPANRRLSSPYVLGRSSGIVTASLQIPVQMQSAQPSDMKDKGVIRRTAATSGNDQLDLTDIPYIEDYGCDQEFENWNEGFPVTGSLSFGPGPSSNYPRKLSSSGPTVFQIPIEYEGQQRTQQLAAGAPSSSEATSLNPASKFKSFLSHGSSVYPLSASSIGASAHSSATAEPKLPTSISNIGGAILRSKTADFERMSSTPDTQILRTSQSTAIATTTSKTIENKKSSDDAAAALPSDLNVRDRQRSTRSQTPLYKRQELISSAKRHNKF